MMSAELAELLKTYAEGRLLWEAKGWPMDGVAAHLGTDKVLAEALAKAKLKLDLSQAALSRRSLAGDELPRPVAEAIARLETRPNREHQTGIVVTGLRVLRGEPTSRDPRELALALLAHFPTDELALKVADAVASRAGLSPDASFLDSLGRAIADRLPHVLKLREAKLARHLAQHLDRLTSKRVALAGAAGGIGGGMVACVVLGLGFIAFVGLLLSGRLLIVRTTSEAAKTAQAAPAPHAPSGSEAAKCETAASPEVATHITQPPMLVLYVAQGSAPVVLDWQAVLGAITKASAKNMGEKREKPIDNPVPEKPVPFLKTPPCLAEAGEELINGNCWVETKVPPPCGRYLFRRGDRCYRAVAADPVKPVGLIPSELHRGP